MEDNEIRRPDLTKTGLSEAEGTTDTRPVRRKSEKLRRLLEKRKHVLRKYESISERLKTIDESIRQEEEREILETFRNYGMDGSNLAVLLDQVQEGSDLAERLNAVFQELKVRAEKEEASGKLQDKHSVPETGKEGLTVSDERTAAKPDKSERKSVLGALQEKKEQVRAADGGRQEQQKAQNRPHTRNDVSI